MEFGIIGAEFYLTKNYVDQKELEKVSLFLFIFLFYLNIRHKNVTKETIEVNGMKPIVVKVIDNFSFNKVFLVKYLFLSSIEQTPENTQ
jgi:hypothetical protein